MLDLVSHLEHHDDAVLTVLENANGQYGRLRNEGDIVG